MTKAVFFNIPAHGHVNPTLPLVRELVRRGETVIYYSIEEYKAKIEAAGARCRTYESLSPSVRFDFGSDDRSSPSLPKIARVMIEFCERSLPFLLDATRQDEPDYILHDFTCLWGKYVSQILEIPAIATIPQFPVNMKRRPDPYPGMYSDMIRMFIGGIPALIQFRRTADRISQAYSVRSAGLWDMLANHEDLNIVFTSRYFQPYAEDFDDSFVFVGPSIAERDGTLDFSLDCGNGPLVYISLGTILNINVTFYQYCFEAFGGTEKQIVLSAGADTDLDSIGVVPKNFVVRNYVPQLEILKRADVFVTHGGMNSVSEGLWYGVPLVVIPQGSDQYLVASRVETLKAGVALDKRRITPEALRQAVDSIALDEGILANIETIQDSFREAGGFGKAADEVMRATRRMWRNSPRLTTG
jgi:MGT family glycosyltransferase